MAGLPLHHSPQERRYWCGPAAVRMALATRLNGAAPSQWELAQDSHLRTELHRETPDRIVIRDTLSRVLGAPYRVVDVHGPTEEETARFRADLVGGVDTGWPLVVTMWMRAGQPRPPGYPRPTGDGIKHIVTVFAYEDLGDTVLIADPASNGHDVSWGHQVPPTYPLPIDTLMNLMRGKGYVAGDPGPPTSDARGR